jgi:hypothetical protein
MDGTRKYHPECGNSDRKGHAWYVLTNKWLLAKKKKKYTICKIQSRELKKLNKLNCASKDALVPLGSEEKAITSGEGGREGSGRKSGQGGRIWWGERGT